MIITDCPECGENKWVAWEAGGNKGHSPQICNKCDSLFWVELTTFFGETRTHEAFLEEIAKTDSKRKEIEELTVLARELHNENKQDD